MFQNNYKFLNYCNYTETDANDGGPTHIMAGWAVVLARGRGAVGCAGCCGAGG